MPDHSRIEELRRRIDKDPASIAFAQLAEEYRRAGQFTEAVRTCRAGLARHPTYLSAHVTLGRALLELGDIEAAEAELDEVHRAAPENLAAIRGLEEIRARRVAIAPVAAPAPPASTAPPWPPANRPGTSEVERAGGVDDDAGAAAEPAKAVELVSLDAWLAAILSDRERRGGPS